MPNKLTKKEARFVQEYLIDLNATQAAIRAGYSAKTARQIGYQLLTKLHIQNAIAEAQAKAAEKLEITRERVLPEIADIAFTPSHTPDNETFLSNKDKLNALDKLSRHLGLFEKDNDQRAPTIIIAKDDSEL